MKCERCDGNGKIPRPELLRETRRKLGITLRQMSQKLKVSQGYLSDVECGRRDPTPKIVKGYRLWYGKVRATTY